MELGVFEDIGALEQSETPAVAEFATELVALLEMAVGRSGGKFGDRY
jgi:hypothetical protein